MADGKGNLEEIMLRIGKNCVKKISKYFVKKHKPFNDVKGFSFFLEKPLKGGVFMF